MGLYAEKKELAKGWRTIGRPNSRRKKGSGAIGAFWTAMTIVDTFQCFWSLSALPSTQETEENSWIQSRSTMRSPRCESSLRNALSIIRHCSSCYQLAKKPQVEFWNVVTRQNGFFDDWQRPLEPVMNWLLYYYPTAEDFVPWYQELKCFNEEWNHNENGSW